MLYEWRASAADPDVADPASRREVLRIDENTVVHNLDELAFGPDGLLYATKGDDDMPASGVIDATRIHGSVLRIDVDNPAAGKGYGIPPGNPYASDGDPEVGPSSGIDGSM